MECYCDGPLSMFCAVVYLVCLLCMGIVIPVYGALLDEASKQSHWLSIFYIYLYVVGIAFLLYVQVYLKRIAEKHAPVKKTPQETELPEVVQNDQNQLQRSDVSLERTDPPALETSSPRHVNHLPDHSDTVSETFSMQFYKPRIHGQASIYLRIGAFAFGFGACLYAILFVVHGAGVDEHRHTCESIWEIIAYIFMAGYCFIQTFFIFKSSQLRIKTHIGLSRFGLCHLIGVNLCIWIRQLVVETEEQFHRRHEGSLLENSTEAGSPPTSVSSNHDQAEGESDKCDPGIMETASLYLYPCIVEYALIAAGVLYYILSRIETTNVYDSQNREKTALHHSQAHQRELEESHEHEHSHHHHHHHTPGNLVCEKSHKGLFLGILLVLGTIVSIIVYYVGRESVNAGYVYIYSDLSLQIALLIAVTVVVLRTRDFHLAPKTSLTDDALLVVGFTGNFIHHGFSLFAVVTASDLSIHWQAANGINYALGSVAAVLQTICILRGLRMKARTTAHAQHKPGRGSVVFLLLANLALWAVDTLEMNQILIDIAQIKIYGFVPWALIVHLTVPLSIFFHFHSTVCLADIWLEAFRKRKNL